LISSWQFIGVPVSASTLAAIDGAELLVALCLLLPAAILWHGGEGDMT
jgi:hypothetical protein